ncbi:MAG TPA: YbfB/YjiJ family MFS transporter [Rummeliibacillus sp.]|nr:YbfB/YjiJ family MFS transporter [Rummeliibacillus sp.]
MNRHHAGIIVGAVLFLVVAMGIGRFSFTPILPFLREAEGLSVEKGGWLASANYIGYFVGALWAGFIVKNQKKKLYMNGWICVISILGMGIVNNFYVWLFLRLINGITGGIIFVLTSSMLLDYLARHFLAKWSGYVFSGIGVGIALSGILVPFLEKHFSWQGAFTGLSILSAVFIILNHFLWKKLEDPSLEKVKGPIQKFWTGFMPWITIAYGLEGLGYIVTGTFLVDMIHELPSLQKYASYSWVIVGIGAIPSAPIWSILMSKYKPIIIIASAYILQIIGIILPVISPTIIGVMISALLFGITFVGIVVLTTSYCRELYPTKSASVVSTLTTYYAIGQIIGPLIAGKLVTYFGSYNSALIFAGSVIAFALCLLLFGKRHTQVKIDAKTSAA